MTEKTILLTIERGGGGGDRKLTRISPSQLNWKPQVEMGSGIKVSFVKHIN